MDDEAKEWWQERIPVVTARGNCKRCGSDNVNEENLLQNYYEECRHFGKPSPDERGEAYYIENYNSHAEYLEEYRSQILEPMISKYPIKAKFDDTVDVLFFAHRHSINDYNKKNKKEYQGRTYSGIPVFPHKFALGSTIELFHHAIHVIGMVLNRCPCDKPINLHVQFGSSATAIGAMMHALIQIQHQTLASGKRCDIYSYFVDYDFDGDKSGMNRGARCHQMPFSPIVLVDQLREENELMQVHIRGLEEKLVQIHKISEV